MELQDRSIKLPYGDALPHIKQSLVGYFLHWERRYIGVTSRPDLRSEQHEGAGWERMYVLYEAFNYGIARSMEQELIAFAQESKFDLGVENRTRGGEFINKEGASYVYVLLAKKRRY